MAIPFTHSLGHSHMASFHSLSFQWVTPVTSKNKERLSLWFQRSESQQLKYVISQYEIMFPGPISLLFRAFKRQISKHAPSFGPNLNQLSWKRGNRDLAVISQFPLKCDPHKTTESERGVSLSDSTQSRGRCERKILVLICEMWKLNLLSHNGTRLD